MVHVSAWDDAMRHAYPAACRRLARRIPRRLRGLMDADDLVMDAILSILEGGDRPPPGADMLSSFGRRRLIDAVRAASSAKRGGRRGPLADDAAAIDFAAGAPGIAYPRRPGDDPADAAVAAEALDAALAAAPTPAERRLVLLLAEGHDGRSAAPPAGLGERTAQRLIARIRSRGPASEG